MQILIIEDEPLAAEKLIRHLSKIDTNIEVLAVTSSIQSTIDFLNEHTVDLILSDIHLSDGLSFKIFESTKTDIPIIFTTAFDQYAIQAFKTNSIDYLLKPIRKNSLIEALDKFGRIHKQPAAPTIDFEQLIRSFTPNEDSYKTRFLVQESGSKLKSLSVEEVAYFFADGKYTFIVTKEGKKHFADNNITQLQRELNPKHFFQINRKYIIHIDSIRNMISYSASRLKIELHPPSESEIIVSVDRSPHFKKWLGK